MKKVGKTNKPFSYDLNQIPYDYTVEVINRFKGSDLLDKVSEELWREVHNTIQEAVTKTISKKNKFKKAKWVVRGLCKQLRKEEKQKARDKGEDIQLNAEFQRRARRNKRDF